MLNGLIYIFCDFVKINETKISATSFLFFLLFLQGLILLLGLALCLLFENLFGHSGEQIGNVFALLGTDELEQRTDFACVLLGKLVLYLLFVVSIDFISDDSQD